MTKDVERFTLRIPRNIKSQLQMCSNDLCVSLNAFIVQILRDWAEKTK